MSTFALRALTTLGVAAFAGIYLFDIPVDLGSRAKTVPEGQGSCGTVYRVVPGDTLHKIAARAYGTGDYRPIFEANRHTLTSAARIEIGDELVIPCRDGLMAKEGTATRATVTAAAPAEAEPVSAPAAPAAPMDGTLRFITGSDFAPFVHPALPRGGMVTEMVRLAMSDAAPGRKVAIALDEDWTAHPGLLAEGAFDLGFPWYRPDCAKVGRLGPAMQRRCAEFAFSDPLFEVPVAYYVRAGDPLAAAASYSALGGRRICRPADHFTFDLEQEGLGRPHAALSFPARAADCFAQLADGEADVVTLARPVAQAEIARAGLAGQVAEVPALASVQTLHVVAPKADPAARANLALVNGGLARLRESGRWFEVASRHFGAFGVSIR